MTGELLQQVRVIDPISATDYFADVLIYDNYIRSVTHNTVSYTHLRAHETDS